MQFAMKYHQLSAPLTEIRFKEHGKTAVWTISPSRTRRLTTDSIGSSSNSRQASTCRFIATSWGLHSGHRSFISLSETAFGDDGRQHFECPALYDQPENQLVFDAHWLDGRPNLGNAVTYAELSNSAIG